MSKKDKRNINQTYDFDEILEKRNVTSPTPNTASDDLMATVASIGDTGRVWCPECRKKGIDHEIKETDDINQHYIRGHSDIPLTGFAWNIPDKTLSIRGKIKDDLRYMRDVNDFKKGGGKWDDIPDDTLKVLIEQYKKDSIKTINMAASKAQADNLRSLFDMYIDVVDSDKNPDRELFIKTLETLHSFSSSRQAINNGRITGTTIILKALKDNRLFNQFNEEGKRMLLEKFKEYKVGGKRRKKRIRKKKKTRKKRKRKSRKRKSKKRRRKK